MQNINKFLKKYKKNKSVFMRVLIAVVFFPLIIFYSLIHSIYIIACTPYLSFEFCNYRKKDGTYKQSFHDHLIFKRRLRAFTAVSVVLVITMVMGGHFLSAVYFGKSVV